jgi:hypothetical protein
MAQRPWETANVAVFNMGDKDLLPTAFMRTVSATEEPPSPNRDVIAEILQQKEVKVVGKCDACDQAISGPVNKAGCPCQNRKTFEQTCSIKAIRLLDTGRGSREALSSYCEPDATFSCSGLPTINTVSEYAGYVTELLQREKSGLVIHSMTHANTEGGVVSIFADFTITTQEGTSKAYRGVAAYLATLNKNKKVAHLQRIVDTHDLYTKLGWSLPSTAATTGGHQTANSSQGSKEASEGKKQ